MCVCSDLYLYVKSINRVKKLISPWGQEIIIIITMSLTMQVQSLNIRHMWRIDSVKSTFLLIFYKIWSVFLNFDRYLIVSKIESIGSSL